MLQFLSGTFLMIGSVIGGGILAIPIVSAHYGFLTTALFILFSWALMTKTGLYILDLSLSCPEHRNSYYSIIGKYLGRIPQQFSSVLFLGLLYLSLASYISGCVSVLIGFFSNSTSSDSYAVVSIVLVALSAFLLSISAKIILRMNVFIVFIKLSLLITAIILSFPHHASFDLGSVKTMASSHSFSLLLVVINAFGFQFILPSLVNHYSGELRSYYRKMLLTSTFIVLCLYLAWLFVVYAVIPMEGVHGLLSIAHAKNQLLAFNQSLSWHLQSGWMADLISNFETVALFGSFFCISLGLYDFLKDFFKGKHKLLSSLMTFLPPLLLSLYSENMYIKAMFAAGYIAVILEIIFPILAMRKARKTAPNNPYLAHE